MCEQIPQATLKNKAYHNFFYIFPVASMDDPACEQWV